MKICRNVPWQRVMTWKEWEKNSRCGVKIRTKTVKTVKIQQKLKMCKKYFV